jgi:hypothetical protein
MPFELSLSPEQLSVQAGQSTEITVQIRNTGDTEEAYTVEVLGLDPSVYHLAEPGITVAPQALGERVVVLCPPAGGNIRTATYRFRLRATSGSREQLTSNASVTIEPSLALKLDLLPTGRGQFDVSLHNEADRELEVQIKAEGARDVDPARACDFLLERPTVRLRGGEKVRVPLRVKPRRRPLVGGGQAHAFTVRATPEIRNARSETREGLARSSAILPWWLLILLLLLVIGSGVAALMGLPLPATGGQVERLDSAGGGGVKHTSPGILPKTSARYVPRPRSSDFQRSLSWAAGVRLCFRDTLRPAS